MTHLRQRTAAGLIAGWLVAGSSPGALAHPTSAEEYNSLGSCTSFRHSVAERRVRARFVQKCTLTLADSELVRVDVDLAVQDDVLPLDRTDPGDELGVEREVGGCGNT